MQGVKHNILNNSLIIVSVMIMVRVLVQQDYFIRRVVTGTRNFNYNHVSPIIWQ